MDPQEAIGKAVEILNLGQFVGQFRLGDVSTNRDMRTGRGHRRMFGQSPESIFTVPSLPRHRRENVTLAPHDDDGAAKFGLSNQKPFITDSSFGDIFAAGGPAVGAAIGAASGLIGKGKSVEMPAGTLFAFRLTRPVSV